MEPIEQLLAAIAVLNGLKKLFSESNSEIERRQLKEKIKQSEQEINRLRRKIAELEKRKGGREVSLRLLYCQHCGKLRYIESDVNSAFRMVAPCQKCGSWAQVKVKTIRMRFKYSHQTSVWLTECPQCGSINEISIDTSAKFDILRCKCHHCGCKFRSAFSHRFRVNL